MIVPALCCPGRLKSNGPKKELKSSGRGDVSPQGLSQKSRAVLEVLTDRLREFSLAWTDVTAVELYTVHNMYPLLETEILPGLANGGHHGLRWHYARPPVTEVEVEMGAQGLYQECILPG